MNGFRYKGDPAPVADRSTPENWFVVDMEIEIEIVVGLWHVCIEYRPEELPSVK